MMSVGEAEAAMKVVRYVMDTGSPEALDATVRESLQVLRDRAYRTLMAGVSASEWNRWLADG